MLNEITNEISEYRFQKLDRMPNPAITEEVFAAMDRISPGAKNGLAGVDAASDGITRTLWEQALSSAESVAALVYGYNAGQNLTLSGLPPVMFEDVLHYVADRVAEAILCCNGYEHLPRNRKVYVVVTLNRYGYIGDLEVMDKKPSFPVNEERMSVYEANINGGDSRWLAGETADGDHICTGP